MVAVGIVGVLTLLAGFEYTRWQDAEMVKSAARKVESAFSHARSEAIRTGNNHIVFVLTDIAGSTLTNGSGDPVPIIVLDDGRPGSTGQNCLMNSGEPTRIFTLEDGVGFGPTDATVKSSIDDGLTAFGGASTFAQTGGGAATWVLFQPDGTPRSVNGACSLGALGSGGGGIYLSNPERDAAVILTPLGATRLFSWNGASAAWN